MVDVQRYQIVCHRHEARKVWSRGVGGHFWLTNVLVNIVYLVHVMDPLEMLSEVVGPWPLLVLLTAAFDRAFEVFSPSTGIGMAASHVSVNIVRSAETFSAGAVGNITVVRLRVLLLVFPACALVNLQKRRC